MSAPATLHNSLLVALGGGTGAWLRYALGQLLAARLGPHFATSFPWATLACNIIGGFAMGLLAGWLARHGGSGEMWRLLLGVGLLGGFTTFSAFSLEFAELAGRGALGMAIAYAAASLAGAIAALYAGLALMQATG